MRSSRHKLNRLNVLIRRLKLTNFRKFEKVEFDLDSDLVVIHGDNAVGKSTILEALHFITNHHSPFTSELQHLYRNTITDDVYFRIEADIVKDGDTRTYALFQNGGSKQYIIDGHRTTKKKFRELVASTIFSPEQIEQLMISPQQRRDFLNSLILKVDPDYEELLSKFNRVLKQRNSYVKRLAKHFYETGEVMSDDRQLRYWSELLSKFSANVMSARINYIEQMFDDDFRMEYRPSLQLEGFESLADLGSLQGNHFNAMMERVRRDIAVGHTTIGAHRDDWGIDAGKDIRSEGSRGEKRLAIGRIIFRSQEIYNEKNGFYPLLMLDDISSELDDRNTTSILDKDLISKQQTIITTIKLHDLPQEVLDNAKVIELKA